jgi:LmbE family N-acetylglucosaminyl deacetylase
VATLVTFHAHPDDEAIATGGVMAQAARAGHRVVLITATDGGHGEVADGFLAEGEALAARRAIELREAGRILGASRVEQLGYVDSGMMGTPENDLPGSFWQADVEEAAAKLAAILREEKADVLTIYDDHGGYGHPDHIQVHRVGVRAAELAGVERVYESTVDRAMIRKFFEQGRDEAGVSEDDVQLDLDTFGSPPEMITTRVDVTDVVEKKRAAMRAHASQITEESFFLKLPDEMFALAFGTECFIRRGAAPGTVETDLFDGLT